MLVCGDASAGALVEPEEPAQSPPPLPADRDCDRTYGELTFGIGGSTRFTGDILEGGALALNRAAFGRAVRFGCETGLETRLGLFADIASGDFAQSVFLGFGLEGEVNYSLDWDTRLGVRLGLEHHGFAREAGSKGSTVIPTLGARLRFPNIVLGVDAFYLRYRSDLWGRSTGAGGMVTLGYDGVRAAGVNMIAIAIGFSYAILLATAQ